MLIVCAEGSVVGEEVCESVDGVGVHTNVNEKEYIVRGDVISQGRAVCLEFVEETPLHVHATNLKVAH